MVSVKKKEREREKIAGKRGMGERPRRARIEPVPELKMKMEDEQASCQSESGFPKLLSPRGGPHDGRRRIQSAQADRQRANDD